MYTKAQGYLLYLLLVTAKADFFFSLWIRLNSLVLKDRNVVFLIMEVNFEGRVEKKRGNTTTDKLLEHIVVDVAVPHSP